MANNFRKGDIVEVVNNGQQYSSFSGMFMKLGLNNYRYNECIRESGPFVVLSTVDGFVGIRSLESGIEYCFGYTGLKLVDKNVSQLNTNKQIVDLLEISWKEAGFKAGSKLPTLRIKDTNSSLKFILNLKR